MTEIKSKDFVLRTIKLSDTKGYWECHQDKDARKGFMSVPETLAEARKELAKICSLMKKNTPDETFAIEVDNEFAGYVHLKSIPGVHHQHQANIAYCIHPKFRGRGITTKAVKLVTNYAFKKYKLKRIDGWCRTFNKASSRVLEKAGYKLEGILRKNKCKDGKYFDDMIWAKIR